MVMNKFFGASAYYAYHKLIAAKMMFVGFERRSLEAKHILGEATAPRRSIISVNGLN